MRFSGTVFVFVTPLIDHLDRKRFDSTSGGLATGNLTSDPKTRCQVHLDQKANRIRISSSRQMRFILKSMRTATFPVSFRFSLFLSLSIASDRFFFFLFLFFFSIFLWFLLDCFLNYRSSEEIAARRRSQYRIRELSRRPAGVTYQMVPDHRSLISHRLQYKEISII